MVYGLADGSGGKSRMSHCLPDLPCGCPSATRVYTDPPQRVVYLPDGSRLCACGRRWSLVWSELLMGDGAPAKGRAARKGAKAPRGRA